MTTQLRLYNKALRNLGERRLSAVDENIEPRRILDDIYNDEAIKNCLEQGYWNFAMRTQEVSFDPGITPSFGYRFAFTKPDDWVNTYEISTNQYFDPPLLQFHDEGNNWFCDHQTIYIRYVSDDSAYGSDLSLWPETFAEFVGWYLAKEAAGQITGTSADDPEIKKGFKDARKEARSNDVLNQAVKFGPQGSWSGARAGRYGGRSDRGNPGSLTG